MKAHDPTVIPNEAVAYHRIDLPPELAFEIAERMIERQLPWEWSERVKAASAILAARCDCRVVLFEPEIKGQSFRRNHLGVRRFTLIFADEWSETEFRLRWL